MPNWGNSVSAQWIQSFSLISVQKTLVTRMLRAGNADNAGTVLTGTHPLLTLYIPGLGLCKSFCNGVLSFMDAGSCWLKKGVPCDVSPFDLLEVHPIIKLIRATSRSLPLATRFSFRAQVSRPCPATSRLL